MIFIFNPYIKMINEIAKLFRDYMEISEWQKSEKEKVQLPVLKVSMNSHLVSDMSVLILEELLVAFKRWDWELKFLTQLDHQSLRIYTNFLAYGSLSSLSILCNCSLSYKWSISFSCRQNPFIILFPHYSLVCRAATKCFFFQRWSGQYVLIKLSACPLSLFLTWK